MTVLRSTDQRNRRIKLDSPFLLYFMFILSVHFVYLLPSLFNFCATSVNSFSRFHPLIFPAIFKSKSFAFYNVPTKHKIKQIHDQKFVVLKGKRNKIII